MKKILLAAAIALPMTSSALFADDSGPVNFATNITAVEMTNDELSLVTGSAFDICIACLATNTAVVTQANLSLISLGTLQGNDSNVSQSNN